MGIRGILRAAVLLLLIRIWLVEGSAPDPTASFHPDRSTVPDIVQDLFNCKNCASEAVVHKVLDRVLMGYDGRLRPNFGGDPVPVGISIYISSIEQISEINMDYTITMFFQQTWKDPRLAYYETKLNLTLDYQMLEKLWVPDCYFLNSKDASVHDVTVENRVFLLHPDGTVRYGIRLSTTAACSMNLQKFPLDKQACKLEIESYGYTVEDIVLFWEGNGQAVHGTEELHIPEFSFLGKTVTSKEVYFYTGSYMRLILRFQVQREVKSFLVQIYWPTVLTTVLSWISFWMNYDSSAARVTVGLTSMLILTTIDSHMRNKLPPVSCIKAIDIYVIVCFFFVFFSLLEYVYINYLFYSRGPQHHHRRRRRDKRVIYCFREVMLDEVQVCLLSIEDDVDSLLSIPAVARLASPESFSSSSASSPEHAQLAASESVSSLCSVSSQAPTESQSQPSSFSAQTLLISASVSEIRNRTDGRSPAEDLDENSSSDEIETDEQPLLNHDAGCTLEASWSDDGGAESGYTWSLEEAGEEILVYVHEEDSGSEFDDIWPLSPGCCSQRGLFSELFNPDYVPKVDRWSRFLFPLAFGLFNIAYWAYHID
ncbi:PREDICTED: gamma-aminobutyric acid receptor subunit theta-like [Elephantulus edwardii]|uniref:gamma-aminobutyric acid receptor subunit theta-like n=1 Tax=Elephantulus edwardii TaxID=28737 RepID=UPI0003F0E526|nr:PREDICTED: gamma-aminobutyric acid receptor subunit theta-like [Elephantulus edwardii]